jgi:Flp pilus assembly protein CpaB
MLTSNKSSIKLIVIALVLGVVGALLAMLYLNAKEAQLRDALKPTSEPIGVVVASRDLVKGEVLNSSSLSVRPIPRDFVSNLAVLPGDFDSVEGKVLQVNLARGKPLLNTFIGTEFPLDFSDTIVEKRRAMTIQIDEINSFTGLLRPGNKIDLFVLGKANSTDANAGDSKVVLPVLENVEVLATGKDTAYDYEEKIRLLRGGIGANPQQNFTTITINVTPKQAAILSLAQDEGDIIALLRNRKDISGSGFAVIDKRSILANALELVSKGEQRKQADQLAGNIVLGEDGVMRTRDGKVLANQNLVIGKDGSIRTKSGIDLASRGLSINENGEIVTADGRIVDPDDLIFLADGTLMTKDGVILDGPRMQALAGKLKSSIEGVVVNGRIVKGATLDENGNLILADGTVVDPDDIVFNADGTVSKKDGTLLAGVTAGAVVIDGNIVKGATLDENGNLVLADGTVVDPDDIVFNADGTVSKKDGTLLAGLTTGGVVLDGKIIKGATLDEDGNLVLADGTVVNPDDIVFNADGTVSRKDGTLIAGLSTETPSIVAANGTVIKGATLDENGNLVLADGTVVNPNDVVINSDGTVSTRDGTLLAGLSAETPPDDSPTMLADGSVRLADGTIINGATIDKDGNLVLADGTVVSPSDIIIRADGSIATKNGQTLAGLTVTADPSLAMFIGTIDYIVGGVSKDGVAEVQKVPVAE